MRDQCEDASDVQAGVTLVSAIGLTLVMLPTIFVVRRFADESLGLNLRSTLFLVAIGWPLALGFLTRWWPQDLHTKRRVWLLSFIGILAPAYFLHGLGIFLIAASLVYPWAFWMTRSHARQRQT